MATISHTREVVLDQHIARARRPKRMLAIRKIPQLDFFGRTVAAHRHGKWACLLEQLFKDRARC
jgi:hypothetical protein